MFNNLARYLSADLGYNAFKAAYARFTGIVPYGKEHRFLREFDVHGLKAVLFYLLAKQKVYCYPEFFRFSITRKFNYLHPVLQWKRNIVLHIRCGNEHYVREVICYLHVVVNK